MVFVVMENGDADSDANVGDAESGEDASTGVWINTHGRIVVVDRKHLFKSKTGDASGRTGS